MALRFTVAMTFLFSCVLCLSAPLTTEEVVRLFAAGESTPQLIAKIEQSEPEFNLSPSMLQELRAARIPESVIRAMQLRQQRAAPLIEEGVGEGADAPPDATLTLQRGRLTLNRRVTEEIAIGFDLPNTDEDRTFSDLAIYVICTSPEHVPERWRNHTPLGRDFHSMPRHRLIGFHSSGNDAQTRKLRFDLPETVDLALADEAPHDLTIGIAAYVGGAFRRITDDLWLGVNAETIESGLHASAGGKSLTSFRVEFTNKPIDPQPLEIKRSGEP
jgi:hypothetical protein